MSQNVKEQIKTLFLLIVATKTQLTSCSFYTLHHFPLTSMQRLKFLNEEALLLNTNQAANMYLMKSIYIKHYIILYIYKYRLW